MTKQQRKFIEFLLQNKALLFGDFILKSGRRSPYFFNLGILNSGEQVIKIGEYYARCIVETYGDDFDIVFGPAYKGIPLSVAIVVALHRLFHLNKRYCANRKEIKEHGEQSPLIGGEIVLNDRIIVVDDVLTTGETKYAALRLLSSIAPVVFKGLVIALDRGEKDERGESALARFKEESGVSVKSIISVKDVLAYVSLQEAQQKFKISPDAPDNISEYLLEYGIL